MKHWLVCLVSCLLWTCCASQGGCEEPPDINFGEIVSDERVNYQAHDRIQYGCDPGYTLEGSEWIRCDGQRWTSPPKCLAPCSITRQQLDAKNLLLSGGRRRSQLIRSNLTLEFVCREGYVITAPSVRKCVNGHMDLPSCISERGKNCSRPPPVENGDIINLLQKVYSSGSWVEFKCQRYYAMEGPNRSFCNNGTWTKVPACLEPCVIALPESHQIEVKGSTYNTGFPMTYLPRGDSIEVRCKPGYVHETNTSQAAFLIQCNGELIVYPKCKEITCNRPQLYHGAFRPQRNVYRGGDLIQIECNRSQLDYLSICQLGFQLEGFNPCQLGFQLENRNNIAECTSSGWSPSPQCDNPSCGDPPTIENGNFKEYRPEGKHISRWSVVYQCNDGFELSGPREIVCRNRNWPQPPTCNEKPCRSLPAVLGRLVLGRKKTIYQSGETVTYACHPAFVAAGPLTVTCRRGEWTEPPTCEAATCPPPPSVEHGWLDTQQKERYLPFEKVHYRCDPGWSLFGPPSVQCLNKQWTELPECRETGGRCGRPPVIENGDTLEVAALQYASDAVVTYKCQLYYLMHGQSAVRCVNGHWTEAPTCKAPCTPAEEDMLRHKIQFKWRSAEKLYVKSGGMIEFSCRRGFHPDPSSPPFRVQCIEGKLEYPKCTRATG